MSQFCGQPAILAAVAPGFAVRPVQTDNTAAGASPSSTRRAICSVTVWATPASRRARKVDSSGAREPSECASVAVPTCYSPFRKGRVECASARTCAFAQLAMWNLRPPAASSKVSPSRPKSQNFTTDRLCRWPPGITENTRFVSEFGFGEDWGFPQSKTSLLQFGGDHVRGAATMGSEIKCLCPGSSRLRCSGSAGKFRYFEPAGVSQAIAVRSHVEQIS